MNKDMNKKEKQIEGYTRLCFAVGRYVYRPLSGLTPRMRKILSFRFGLEDGITHTLEEVGKEFGVTRERIRQMQAKALEIIKRSK